MQVLLETPRLLLRHKLLEDAPFLMELNSNLLVTQYTGDGPIKNLEEAQNIVRYVMGQYEKNGYGRWLVMDKETKTPLGWCGLKYHADTQETDLGYRFMEMHWGKGYATEASLACITYGFDQLKLPGIIGTAMVENTASLKVLKKVGMTFFGNTVINNMPSYIYRIQNTL